MGTAKTRAQNKYIAKSYDRINLTVPKGMQAEIKAHAAGQGESVNGFINRAIDETMQRDSGLEARTTARSVEAISISGEAQKAPQRAAEAALPIEEQNRLLREKAEKLRSTAQTKPAVGDSSDLMELLEKAREGANV